MIVIQLRGQHNLLEAVHRPAPERSMPSVIQIFNRSVTFSQPPAKLGLAVLTITIRTVLIGDMPYDQSRMIMISLRHGFRDRRRPFPVFQTVIAEEHTHTMCPLSPGNIHRQHLRIPGRQPRRLCCRRRCKAYGYSMSRKFIHQIIQPFKSIDAFVRFQFCPGKNRQRHQIDSSLPKKTQILLHNGFLPLIRIIVSPIIDLRRPLSHLFLHSEASLLIQSLPSPHTPYKTGAFTIPVGYICICVDCPSCTRHVNVFTVSISKRFCPFLKYAPTNIL